MGLKECSSCKKELPLVAFSKNKSMKDGFSHVCKSCAKLFIAKWKEKNPGKAAEATRIWRKNNPDSAKQSAKKSDKRRVLNPKRHLQVANAIKQWRKNNNSKVRGYTASRRASQMLATPAWGDKEAIFNFYKLASVWNKIWPEDPVHVDHIIPLKGKYVTGLHVETNLQIIRAADNIRKSNKLLDISST